MIEDEKIIEMFFGRSEQGIRELDIKYGKVCHKLSYNIVNSRQDAHKELPAPGCLQRIPHRHGAGGYRLTKPGISKGQDVGLSSRRCRVQVPQELLWP